MGGGGGGGTQTVGHRYFMSVHMGVSAGPVDEIIEIKVGERTAWNGSVTSSTQIIIDQPDLFGGESMEGGIRGSLDVMMGEDDQPINLNIVNRLGGIVPAFRRMVTLFYTGLICCNNPYPKPWNVRIRRNIKGWDGDTWEPGLAVIPLTDPNDVTGAGIHAANPAHILFQCNTNRDWGRQIDRARLDHNSYLTAAQTLFNEQFGLCLRWSRSGTVSEFIQSIINHIGAAQFLSRRTGLLTVRLIRDDYDVSTLPTFDAMSGLLGIDEDSTSSGSITANEVIVTFRSPIDNSDRQVRERNLGAIRAAGGVISTKTDYPGIPTAVLAHRVAARDVRANTAGLRRYSVRVDRRGYALEPGGVFVIKAPERGITQMVLRIGSIDYGTLSAGTVTLTAIQDVFGLPSSGMSQPENPTWTPPDTQPRPVPYHQLYEASYRDLMLPGFNSTVVNEEDSSGYLVSLGARPTSLALNYQLEARIAPEEFALQGMGNFTPFGRLSADLEILETETYITGRSQDWGLIVEGSAALIGDELARVDAFDLLTGAITFGRGCVDTQPRLHTEGTAVWFYENYNGFSSSPWWSGLVINARMLTRTSSAVLPAADAPVDSIKMNNRARRPYLPGKIKVNGVSYPAQAENAASYVMTWAHRDRKLQAEQLIDCHFGDIGPEDGTEYKITIYDSLGVMVKQFVTFDNAISIPYETPEEPEPTDTSHRLTLSSMRDGLSSYQYYSVMLGVGHVVEVEEGEARGDDE
ncbi:phage tail protein [Serratia fonticola]|uniref:phage tail protein n=1 Tax=Serratia fonticola TaxID=47917 RepID=UPI003AAAF068